MPNSEDRYISFTPHLASFYLDWLHKLLSNPGGGGGARVLPYISHIGMCVVLLRNGAGFTSLKGNSKQSCHFTKKQMEIAPFCIECSRKTVNGFYAGFE